ncbi:aminomethyl-transferring glycine dehydrogenase subunit GcvPB [Clostridium sporogenes]|jgi:glycine dehydrogenase subunit 2|uniref:Probable glycine dehydrogenase (decarboxylating) subunit 2 n=2 Tax=Clostridium TaxID=1485 RepID=A0A0D1BV98_CLOBO|nr:MULTISPECIES: aminomethyl-transferring glycine dehydrogenase subunit GcvPB [Clostridium]MBE6077145.1 glycine dehydrogenase subunit 2 [Clostridium lundense]MDU2832187.1 aminomethyl-transferring glycine dehydrogenase subunit GcvPB [Clostridium botulinum]KIS22716.1 glycine dehydrogenase [Clostridium botulinum B2 450]MCW6092729.1 aminomethyl-transferring glycine dehydrogenase subunit GcvPB [Clostridium sporogenes]MCW7998567.1 glycine dehydrogenase (aminomethyl-transferring) [Clostridium sp. cpc
MKDYNKVIFELSSEGRKGYRLPNLDVPEVELSELLPKNLLREDEINLPEVSEVDVVRHYTALSSKNYTVDNGFYPLGSCTMKYNPKINEDMAALSGFSKIHPLQDENISQGALELMYDLKTRLCEITGLDDFTLQPAAGAHGEYTGLLVIKAYHKKRGDTKRTKIIVPDSAHGTNPASASVAGFDIVEIKSGKDGRVSIEELKKVLNDEIAGLMLTNPSTLGLFEKDIKLISELVHEAGGLLYYDGANLNAIMGIARPGDMGFDVCHLNMHKTFSTPHGGGGPGSGPVGVKKHLAKFLPVPTVEKENDKFILDYNRPDSLGKIRSLYGNFGVMVKAYTYILTMGKEGLKAASENAVLNANYIKESLREYYNIGKDDICKHEVILSTLKENPHHIATLDIAKRLIDYGMHPPTVYFPLIIEEALMIEPTESESKETVDEFIDAMKKIAVEAKENPELLHEAPVNAPVRRLDQVKAARKPILRWKK